MSKTIVTINPWVAQTPQPTLPAGTSGQTWMYASGGLFAALLILGIISQVQFMSVKKQLKFERYKNQELQKRVKFALMTITKMERNPDLIHSRDFNLDYLRMRMEEEHFHFSIVNQLKVKVKQQVSVALRPQQAEQGVVGISSKPRQVDQTFDVEYAAGEDPKGHKRILFRVQIKLTKLPTQSTSTIISEIIDCIENFLSPEREEQFWQPTLLGRLASMNWDQKAKPTPLLVLEQTNEGVNVTLRSSNRRIAL
jgi:hypothetical protein